jgi:hypothetical protein
MIAIARRLPTAAIGRDLAALSFNGVSRDP